MKTITPQPLPPQLTLEHVFSIMDKEYQLTYVDYQSSFDEQHDILEKCLEAKSSDLLHETVDEWYVDSDAGEVSSILAQLKKECEENYPDTETFFDDNEDSIRDEIYNRNNSDVVGDLIDNTDNLNILVEMHSNYDCINSHWCEDRYSYLESYFGAMVNALNLNPRKVAKAFKRAGIRMYGKKFPNRAERNGKEFVSYSEFVEEIENSSCPVNLLTFVATVPLEQLFENDFNLSEVTIPKGNKCGIFSRCQGGGSLIEMELLHDITLPLNKDEYDFFSLKMDESPNNGYSLKDTYGVCNSFFGETATLQKAA